MDPQNACLSLNISSQSGMDTGKCNGFLKGRILLAGAGNQNVTVNRKIEFFFTSKQTDRKLIVSVSHRSCKCPAGTCRSCEWQWTVVTVLCYSCYRKTELDN